MTEILQREAPPRASGQMYLTVEVDSFIHRVVLALFWCRGRGGGRSRVDSSVLVILVTRFTDVRAVSHN